MTTVSFPFLNAALDMFGLFGYVVLVALAVWFVLGTIQYFKNMSKYSKFKKIFNAIMLIIFPLFLAIAMWNVKTTNTVKVYESSPRANYIPQPVVPKSPVPAAKSDKDTPDYSQMIKQQSKEIKDKVGGN